MIKTTNKGRYHQHIGNIGQLPNGQYDYLQYKGYFFDIFKPASLM